VLTERTCFRREDLFSTSLGEADVITFYLLDNLNAWRPRLVGEARLGTRIVGHAFAMDGWEPEATRQLGHLTLYLWIVGR